MLDTFLLQPNDIKRVLQSSVDELNHVKTLLHTERRFERQLDFRLYSRFLQNLILKLTELTLARGIEPTLLPMPKIKTSLKSQAA